MGAANPPFEDGTILPLGQSGSGADDAPTRPLLVPTAGETCLSCDTPLASDQRYCVNCGERRGQARFSVAGAGTQTAAAAAPATNERHRPRMGSGTTLIAGVATLLLAMGVGVLIGHSGNTTTTRAAASAPPVINVNAGGGGSAAASAHKASTASNNSLKSPTIHISKKVAAAAAAAAAKVTGGAPPVNPTVTVGQGCTANTAGCQNGKFTGNFFGP